MFAVDESFSPAIRGSGARSYVVTTAGKAHCSKQSAASPALLSEAPSGCVRTPKSSDTLATNIHTFCQAGPALSAKISLFIVLPLCRTDRQRHSVTRHAGRGPRLGVWANAATWSCQAARPAARGTHTLLLCTRCVPIPCHLPISECRTTVPGFQPCACATPCATPVPGWRVFTPREHRLPQR